MVESRTKRAKTNIITGFLNKLIVLGMPFIIKTIIIKELGAEYLGLSGVFTSILQVLNMAELGFSSSIIFSLYKPIAKNDTDTICALMAMYRKIYHIIGIVILVTGLGLTPFLQIIIKGEIPRGINIYILYFFFLANTVISYLAFAYKSVLLTSNQRQDIINNIESILSILKCTAQILFLIIFKNFYLYILWNLVYTIFYNIFIAIITKKKYPDYICKGIIDRNTRNEIIKQVKGVALGKICVTTRNSFDSIVLSMFCGLIDVAIYSNYFYVFTAVSGLLGIFTQSITAGVGNSIATESVEKNYYDFLKFNYYFAWIAMVCSCCMICFYQPFMNLWVGKNLIAPISVAVLFTIYFYINTLGQIRSVYAGAAGIWWELKYCEIFEMVSNLVLNFVLGYFLGIKGILLATIITVFIFSIVGISIVIFKIYFKRSIIKYFLDIVYNTITLIFICSFCFYLCIKININNSLLKLLCNLVICGILSNIFILLFNLVNKRYKNYIKALRSYLKLFVFR